MAPAVQFARQHEADQRGGFGPQVARPGYKVGPELIKQTDFPVVIHQDIVGLQGAAHDGKRHTQRLGVDAEERGDQNAQTPPGRAGTAAVQAGQAGGLVIAENSVKVAVSAVQLDKLRSFRPVSGIKIQVAEKKRAFQGRAGYG